MDAKGEEDILLEYFTRSKSCKYLNINTNKVVESVNVKVDKYFELNKERQEEEPKNYKTFMYFYEDMPIEEIVTPIAEQVSVIVKSHPTIVESHLDVELHRDAKH